MIPQVLASRELSELLQSLNTLDPLPDGKVETEKPSSDNHGGVGENVQQHENVQSDHQALLLLVQQLTELLHPYKDHWSFDETVRHF